MTPATPDDDAPLWRYVSWLHELIADRDPALRPLGDLANALAVMRGIADDTRTCVWNMQRAAPAGELLTVLTDRDEIDRRGIESRMIYSRGAVTRNPLLTSANPYLRIGAVMDPFMVVDERLVVVNDSAAGSMWTSEDPEVVRRGVAYYEAEWAAATPALAPGEEPPFTRRTVEVGVHVANGRADREIAGMLGVSERTVSAVVTDLGRRLGATGRGHIIALVNGVG